MSVTMSKTDGVTVFTLTSDPQSSCPPLCQILRSLCYNPLCCSVSQHLRRVQRTSQSVLGALHIMVGLLNICLAVILLSRNPSPWMWDITYCGYLYGLGALFILFGIVSILSEKYPSRCLVIVNVILNLTGVAFAITGIVLYSMGIRKMDSMSLLCDYFYDYNYGHKYNSRHTRATPSPQQQVMIKICSEGEALLRMLLRSITAVLLVLSVLELCVTISSAVMGIKALRSREKRENKSTDDPEQNIAGGHHQ